MTERAKMERGQQRVRDLARGGIKEEKKHDSEIRQK